MDLPTATAEGALSVAARSIDDRGPLEAAVARLDALAGELDARLREHTEIIAPILGPEEDVAHAVITSDAIAGCSERTQQLLYLADRFEGLAWRLADLSRRAQA